MARFLFWSDLHTEFAPFALPAVDAPIDAVLLGGDTALGDAHLSFAYKVWETYGVPVLTLYGNHEFYGTVMEEQMEKDAARLKTWQDAGIPIHLLQGDALVINHTRIIGATLWTDMALMGAHQMGVHMRIEQDVEDYKKIRVKTTDGSRKLRALDTIALHMSDRDALFAHLNTPFDGQTLVMTHHVPTLACMNPAMRHDPLTAAFISDLTTPMLRTNADVWLYGHTHSNQDTTLERYDGQSLRLISNMRGYPHNDTPFNPTLIVEV